MNILLKRAYDEPEESDGYRVLVDRLWPRGVKKADLRLDAWPREIAPSEVLRKAYNNSAGNFDLFRQSYIEELDEKLEIIEDFLKEVDGQCIITLINAKKDRKHNNAIVLKEFLGEKFG